MHIAHITATFPPYIGGTGNVCYQNARGLAQLGHQVHVFTTAMNDLPAYEAHGGITIHRLRPLMRKGNAVLLPDLVRVLHGFDVIHLHYPFVGGEMTALYAQLAHIPLVITYHNDVVLNGVMGMIEKIQRRTIGRMTLRSANRLLFTSRDYGRASHAHTIMQGHEQSIDELPNGVDIHSFNIRPPAIDLKKRYRFDEGDRVVLLVAGLDRAHYFKGVDIFIQALARVPSNIKAIIVGDGDLRSEYEMAADRLQIRSRVAFAGRVSDEELPAYYNTADVTVLPSTTSGEAFGLVLIESLASGTPVIATNLPGVRTVVDDGSDGFLVTPGDVDELASAVVRILEDETTRQGMGLKGRAKTETLYDWGQIAVRLEAIYQQVLDESGSRAALSEYHNSLERSSDV